MKLVRQHLKPLSSILKELKQASPDHYRRAILDLDKSARRLRAAERRGKKPFQLELAVLKSRTSADLLAAKLSVEDDDATRKRLRQAVQKLKTTEQARARHDVEILEQRFDKLKKQLDAAKRRLNERSEAIESQIETTYESYVRKAKRTRGS
ncbi:MAG: hypothetical protein AAGA03_00605 [Planctomycetota bacterium]